MNDKNKETTMNTILAGVTGILLGFILMSLFMTCTSSCNYSPTLEAEPTEKQYLVKITAHADHTPFNVGWVDIDNPDGTHELVYSNHFEKIITVNEHQFTKDVWVWNHERHSTDNLFVSATYNGKTLSDSLFINCFCDGFINVTLTTLYE